MIDLATPPAPLSRRERQILIIISVAGALSRLPSLARTPWDWDEILFSLGLREFDVVKHNPHPPGFPLYILGAKFFRLFGLSDFHSLQAVNLIAGIVLVPVTVMLCRELRFRFGTSVTAALLLAFMPNVWFFGGTAFSDVPSMVLVVAASAFLLRGARSGTALLAGAALLGVAAGFRPQNLMIGAVPALIATVHVVRRRQFRNLAAAIVIGVVITGGSYAGAALATGDWSSYSRAIRLHRQYIDKIDSFRAPSRPTLGRIADDFFVRPFRVSPVNWTLLLLSVLSFTASLLRLRWPVLIVIAAFLPFWIIAWLVLDYHSTSRFSIAWMPLLAILAADGIWILAAIARTLQNAVAAVMTLALTGAMIAWTLPALETVRIFPTPPMQAIDWVQQYAHRSARLYVHKSMAPYAAYFLSSQFAVEDIDGAPAVRLSDEPAYYLTERQTEAGPAHQFRFARGNLWNLVRRRYFVVSVVPLTQKPEFGEGWYDEESSGTSNWRWMGSRSVTTLRPYRRPARLYLRISTPLRQLPRPPVITVSLNGSVLDRFTPSQAAVERTYEIARPPAMRNSLVIETDRVVNPLAAGLSKDPRDLGIRLEGLEWITIDP